VRESKVRIYSELDKYPTYEENDIWMPFMEGIDVGEQDNNIPGNRWYTTTAYTSTLG